MATTTSSRPRTAPKAKKQAKKKPVKNKSRFSSAYQRVLAYLDTPTTSYYLIAGSTALLLLLGLIMVLSSSSVESLASGQTWYAVFLPQAIYTLAGLAFMFIAMKVPVHWWTKLSWVMLAGAALLQLLVFVPGLGVTINGNRNWIRFAGVQFQPSELIKLTLAIWLGTVLASKYKQGLLTSWMHVLIPVVPVSLVAVGLVMMGNDLGTALVLVALVMGALFIAGIPMRMFGTGVGVAAVGVLIAAFLSANRTSRITAWLSANCDGSSECYQVLQGQYGLASGGLFGRGLGASRAKWSYLPEAHNDFIFAIIGEELGLLGSLLVLVLFVALCIGLTRIIRRHPDPFVKITVGAITVWIIGQACLNIGMVLGLLPVIGVPLPLFSSGGSALITTLVALGIALSFARDEPDAAKALKVNPGVVKRTLSVVGSSRGERR